MQLLPGSTRLGSARLGFGLPGGGWHGSLLARGRLRGCPDFLPAAERIGAVPFLFQHREDLGLSRSPSHPRRGRSCPPLPTPIFLQHPCAVQVPVHPLFFWGGGAGCSLRWARRALGDATTFVGAVWAKSRWRRAPPPPPGFVPLPMKLFPRLQTPACADWHFFSPVLWGFFSCLYLTPFSFFLFLSQRIFFPIGIPSPRSSSRFCRGMFWMLT